jgi:hypothetical protein
MNNLDDDAPTQRRSIRLRGHDYASPGAYYVTIWTHGRQELFGHIEDGSMIRNTYGDVIAGRAGNGWRATSKESVSMSGS